MSEENYQFIKMPTDLLYADISLSQFKLIAFIISAQIPDKETGLNACFYGYKKIAEYLNTSKGAVIKNINELTAKGIIINGLSGSGRAKGICVDFSAIGGLSKSGYVRSLNETLHADKGSLNESERSQIDSQRSLNETSHIDNRFKNIYLKYNTGEGYLKKTPNEENEPNRKSGLSDVADKRTIANEESARNDKGSILAEKDAATSALIVEKYPTFRAWYSLFRHGEVYEIRPISNIIGRMIPYSERINSAPYGTVLCGEEAPRGNQQYVKIL